MKKAKKIVSFLLAVSMVAGLMSACTQTPAENPGSTTPSQGESTPTDTPSEEENKYEEKMTFTMSTIDADLMGVNDDGSEAADFKWLKEKFNVDFECRPMTWSDYIQQTNLWLNSDDAPDLIMLDVAAVRYGEFLEWVDAGLFKAYPDISNYPNLQARFDTMTTGKKFEVDGKLYAWPAYQDTVDYKYTTPIGYKYRVDWAKEVGLYHEDDVYTWDEWWALLDAIQEKKPGGPETIPTMVSADWAFPSYFTAGIAPYMLKFAKGEDGKWVWGATLPETKEALEFIKGKYDSGIIWKDQLLFVADVVKTEFSAGHLFSEQMTGTSTKAFMDSKKDFESANEGLVYEDVFSIAKVKSPNGKFCTWQNADQWSQEAMNHNLSDEKAARWCDMLDYLASDEGYYVRNMGIPEVDWKWEGDEAVALWTEKNEDGTLKRPSQGFWPWARIAGVNDNFSNYSPEYPEKVQKMVLSVLEAYSGPESQMIPKDAEVEFFTDEAYLKATEGLEKETYTKIAELLAKDSFIADWEAWVQQKSAELQPAVDALNAAGF